MDINKMTASHIRRIRNAKKLKLEYVAYKIGLSKGSYSQLENGKVELTLSKLSKVALVLDIPLNSILPIDYQTEYEVAYIQNKIPMNDSKCLISALDDIIEYISNHKSQIT